MELEELQSAWTKMSNELDQQKKFVVVVSSTKSCSIILNSAFNGSEEIFMTSCDTRALYLPAVT